MTSADVPSHVDLTPRESEVLAMVAEGKTNREIGAALYISESTAGVHVSNILAKLGVASRTEAAAIAIRAGLLESATGPAEGEAQAEPEPALAPSEPEPIGWRARIRAQMRRHPRSTAVAGGSVVVLAALTTGLTFAVLTSDRPTGAADASTSPSAVTGSSEATEGALASFPPTPTPSPTPSLSSGTPSPTPSSSGTPSATPSATATPRPTPSATASPRPAPSRTPTPTAAPTPSPSVMWTAAGDGIDNRVGHTATLLTDGSVLIVGGDGVQLMDCLATVERYFPRTKLWRQEAPMNERRCEHTATLLDDGQVLVVGGRSMMGNNVFATAELYDPIAGTWTAAADLSTPRAGHWATLLADGRVLVLGGRTADAGLASAEIYDPLTGRWTPTGGLADARSSYTATRLPDGRVLVAGGASACCGSLSSAELYDPASGTWSSTGSMSRPRQGAAALYWDGGVLVVGGTEGGSRLLTSAEIYDPSAIGTRWHSLPATNVGRVGPTLTQLKDGTLLLIGGLADLTTQGAATVERFDSTRDNWVSDGSLPDARCCHTATLLEDGTILVVGSPDPSDQFAALLYIPLAER